MKHMTIAMVLGLFVGGCGIDGNGDIITETRSVSEFEGVELSVSVDTYLVASDFYEVSITCDSNLVARIDTIVSRGTLEVETSRLIDAGSECFVIVQAPYFDRVVVNGSGDVEYDDAAPVENLYARVNGSGEIDITGIESDQLTSRISGSGTISLRGSTRMMDATTEGSGEIRAGELFAEIVNADTLGSGDIEVFASQRVDASTHGSGDIIVYGSPPSADVSTEGSGRVLFK